jgi:hypothetical protein
MKPPPTKAGTRTPPSKLVCFPPLRRGRSQPDGPACHTAAAAAAAHTVRVRVEIMGAPKCRNAGESQSVLIVIDPIISTRTRSRHGGDSGWSELAAADDIIRMRSPPPPIDAPCTQGLRHGDPMHSPVGPVVPCVAADDGRSRPSLRSVGRARQPRSSAQLRRAAQAGRQAGRQAAAVHSGTDQPTLSLVITISVCSYMPLPLSVRVRLPTRCTGEATSVAADQTHGCGDLPNTPSAAVPIPVQFHGRAGRPACQLSEGSLSVERCGRVAHSPL